MEFELQDSIDVPAFVEYAPVRLQDGLDELRDEIDHYYGILKRLRELEPDQVFRILSGYSARVSEIRAQVCRIESRRAQSFRTRELEPLLSEIDRQFRYHSRLLSMQQLDWEITGKGQT